MQELERLEKQWNNAARFRGIRANLCLDDEGLTLGAGTLLAKRNHDGSLALDGEEEKVLTLLSIACGKALDPSALKPIRRASEIARDGDECRAAMHVALTKLPNISDPIDAARRLFIAEGLIAAGVAPCDIWKAVGFNPAILNLLAKYNSAEPRVAAGSGKPSGEWTSGGAANANTAAAIGALAPAAMRAGQVAAEEVEAQAPRVLARLPGIALRSASIAARLNLPLSALIETLRASPTGGDRIVGRISGLPNVYYERHQDELAIQLIDKSTERAIAALYPTGVRGQYADQQSSIVGHMEGDELVVRTKAGTIARVKTYRDDPQKCPDPPLPDNNGMPGEVGERSKGYETFMKGETNPGDPTPEGMAFYLLNPVTGRIVKYDDCKPGRPMATMMEYKGLRHGDNLGPNGFQQYRDSIAEEWTDEATRQVQASGGRRLEWHFAQQDALEFARALFAGNPLLSDIKLEYSPWAEGEQWKRSGRGWKRSIRALVWKSRILQDRLVEAMRRESRIGMV
ncbi:MAG TPA: hypothetical protein VMD53_07315 [Rhizomicrobium sp.]|nr:hypothetical protein [Rhizomicrobium sp.]